VHECVPLLHDEDDLHEHLDVGDDLDNLGEVPAEPLLEAHGLVVHFLVDFLQQVDGLDDHGVDLVRGETQFEPGSPVGEPQRHGIEVFLVEVAQLVG